MAADDKKMKLYAVCNGCFEVAQPAVLSYGFFETVKSIYSFFMETDADVYFERTPLKNDEQLLAEFRQKIYWKTFYPNYDDAIASAKATSHTYGEVKLKGSDEPAKEIEIKASALLELDVTFDEQTHLFTVVGVKQLQICSDYDDVRKNIAISLDQLPDELKQISVKDFPFAPAPEDNPDKLDSECLFDSFYDFVNSNGYYRNVEKAALYKQLKNKFLQDFDKDMPDEIQSGFRFR